MKQAPILGRIRGGHCTVLGFGVSNQPLVGWLIDHGAHSVTVRDRRTREEIAAQDAAQGGAAALRRPGVTFIGGPEYLDTLAGETREHIDAGRSVTVFRSPGIKPGEPAVREAVREGAVLSSEMELFLDVTEARVIGITGSDGKTTTTTVTSLLLDAACRAEGKGRMYLGGNIGRPLLPDVERMTPDDFAVVELSSFQLMTVTRSPERAAVTNLSPNHLNWHTDMDEYVRAKTNILTHPPIAQAVLNADNPRTAALGETLPAALPVTWFSSARRGRGDVLPPARRETADAAVYEDARGVIVREDTSGDVVPLLDTARIRLPGRHNIENFMTALALTFGLLPPDVPGAVADAFTGVAHRLELVDERDGVRFYNSSIDSSPSRTCAALAAVADLNRRRGTPEARPTVICGGQDKHVPFDTLADALCREAGSVILTGEARGQIMDALRGCPAFDPARLPVTVIPDWDDAMRTACREAEPGDVVLLSPACTSFDAFRNFEARGERFRKIVHEINERKINT